MTYKLTPVMLVGLITSFTLSDETKPKGVVTICGYRIMVLLQTSNLKTRVRFSLPALNEITEVRLARMKGTLTSWE